MQTFKQSLLFSGILFLLIGCASNYKTINPDLLSYDYTESKDGLKTGYRYGVLETKENKKNAKKEWKKGIRVVAVEITNETDKAITINKDVNFFSGDNQLGLMTPEEIKSRVGQVPAAHLPYLLFSFLVLQVGEGFTAENYPIGLVLGPGLTIGNMSMAASANKKFLTELQDYNVINRELQPGETVNGLIGFRGNTYAPISMKFK